MAYRKQKIIYKRELAKTEEVNKLDQLKKKVNLVLFEAQAVFPFDIVPDRITIDINSVTIMHRYILSRQVFPILIEDIKTATEHNGILFSSLKIEISGYEKNPPPLKYFWPKDTSKARRYILALIEAKREKIDLGILNKEKLEEKLHEIGEVLEKRGH